MINSNYALSIYNFQTCWTDNVPIRPHCEIIPRRDHESFIMFILKPIELLEDLNVLTTLKLQIF